MSTSRQLDVPALRQIAGLLGEREEWSFVKHSTTRKSGKANRRIGNQNTQKKQPNRQMKMNAELKELRKELWESD